MIIQGGGFRTAFSSGVLDAFMEHDYKPFDIYAGVSGGAIAASYYIANQPGHCFGAICFLSEKKRFVDYAKVLRLQPVMNVDVFYDISTIHFPFDIIAANQHLQGRTFAVVMTSRTTGEPYYCDPTQTNWCEAIIASCSLPFISKGKHPVQGQDYMDGAWGDPLPVEWVVAQGATDITVVRTTPANEKIGKSWIDVIGEMYYNKQEHVRKAFSENIAKYNRSVDFINNPPAGITIHQIAPADSLKAGVFTNSKELLHEDYRYGLASGREHCLKMRAL